MNPILMTDSYKLGHYDMYPADTKGIFSYFESRHGAMFDETVFFGLQPLLMDLTYRIRMMDVLTAKELVDAHMGPGVFNLDGWKYIVNELQGKIPVAIRAVPEGTVVPVSNALMTVESTDDNVPWITNYIETHLTHVWYPSTVATLSRSIKKLLANALAMSADNADALDFMLHDFGYRGATSEEAASIGGAAHLVNFKGTDTIAGILAAHEIYGAPYSSIAFSVKATEHSIMTSRGKDGEHGIVDSLVAANPSGILSVVADSYDIYAFVRHVIERQEDICARDGVFVIRPDSITEDHKTPEELVVALLEMFQTFAPNLVHTNSKGYRELDSHFRFLWGDGIDMDGIGRILAQMIHYGWSAANIATFGMGGGLLQKVNRDTQRFAFKCSAQKVNGEWIPVSKRPLDESKASKAGRLELWRDGSNGFITVADPGVTNVHNELKTVYMNGTLMQRYTFDSIRERAAL